MYFYVVLCIVCFVLFSMLFACICVLNYWHWVATQLQLNISYQILTTNNSSRKMATLDITEAIVVQIVNQ
jgi:uncharacterized membrane protein